MGAIDELINKGKLKRAQISFGMVNKEFEAAELDYLSSMESLEAVNFKWATIQAYYAIFHAVRSLLYMNNLREESHMALKLALKELYIDTEKLPVFVYETLERGMELREMADYKASYSQRGAEKLVAEVKLAIKEIEIFIRKQ